MFARKKDHRNTDEVQSSMAKSKSMELSQSPRKLVRRNAAKNFKYTPSGSSSTLPVASGTSASRTRSLDPPHGIGMTSFRIEGNDGEVDWILQNLGLSGLEDLEIPKADYDFMKSILSSVVIQGPERGYHHPDKPDVRKHEANKFMEPLPQRLGSNRRTNVVSESDSGGRDCVQHTTPPLNINVPGTSGRSIGIKGDRPPLLNAPPSMTLLALNDNCCSTGVLLEPLAPDGDGSLFQCRAQLSGDAATDGQNAIREDGNGVSSDDDPSSTITEPPSIISPNSGCRNITQWGKVSLLGSGSFGTVYKAISSQGFFFAIKEVSLLEQGREGKQCICHLEQEIKLLSQFEHENIVQYLGTEKADSNFYIFLELVTEGSLASLYEKCHLHDSHVSAYTRQILMGLKYLHDQHVVHRDIKCANILVASSGTVKLADFGLAKATKLNDLKSCRGTPFWMAPEVIHNNNQGYGLAADIWSLGCTVLEMLTRHVPYYPLEPVSFTLPQALFKISKGKPPPIPDHLSTDARDFIQQCLRVDANDRPSAAELLDHQFVQRSPHTPLGSESPMRPYRSI
ncbi:hypothetical protein RND81_01G216300 [Saponaria officinalis]|uniref:mitogen-activated protein kinase kinase kinase n=1 Tax=Saponaria officinalis TaxID=3572 RepID=A0AAW1NH53_SAPOF